MSVCPNTFPRFSKKLEKFTQQIRHHSTQFLTRNLLKKLWREKALWVRRKEPKTTFLSMRNREEKQENWFRHLGFFFQHFPKPVFVRIPSFSPLSFFWLSSHLSSFCYPTLSPHELGILHPKMMWRILRPEMMQSSALTLAQAIVSCLP